MVHLRVKGNGIGRCLFSYTQHNEQGSKFDVRKSHFDLKFGMKMRVIYSDDISSREYGGLYSAVG